VTINNISEFKVDKCFIIGKKSKFGLCPEFTSPLDIKTIFLRKEIYENEYRCPLVPNDINILCNYGFTIFVQSSETRCFTNYEFEKAGAIITDKSWDNFSNCLIIGIKELDNIDKLNSHTHVY
jgi:hypothetical protein